MKDIVEQLSSDMQVRLMADALEWHVEYSFSTDIFAMACNRLGHVVQGMLSSNNDVK